MTEIQKSKSEESARHLEPHDDRPVVNFGKLDKWAYVLIPEIVRGKDTGIMEATATDLCHEGARGPALRRMLSRSIATTNAERKHREAILAVEFDRVSRGKGDHDRLKLLDDMVERSSVRLHRDINALARLTSANVPNVQIHAHNAAVSVGGQDDPH